MKKMKRMFCFLAILFFVGGSMAFYVHTVSAGNPQAKCPVLENPVNKDVYTDYKGKRIYFCCPGCIKEFKKDPEKYMKKMEEQKVTPEPAPKN